MLDIRSIIGSNAYGFRFSGHRLLRYFRRIYVSAVDIERELFCRVWEGKPLNVNLLRVTVSHLRQRLKNAGLSILSTRGGYRLEI